MEVQLIHATYKIRVAGPGPSLQVTIPPIWWQSNGLQAGDKLMVEIESDRLIIKPLVMREGAKNEIDK